MTTKRLGLLALLLFVGFWLLRFTPTRQLILFLLPLGRGLDDLLEIAALILGAVFLTFYLLRRRSHLS